MCANIVGEEDVIFNNDVPCESDLVRKDVVVADLTVVSYVNANHEEVARSDPSSFTFSVGAMESAELTYQVVVANSEKALLAFEFHVLGCAAKYCVFENSISLTKTCEAFDNGVRADFAVVANLNVVFDNSKRGDSDISADLGK